MRATSLALLLAFGAATTSAEAVEIPSSGSSLYYRLGGGDPASRAPNPSGVPYKLGLSGVARMHYACGAYDFEVSFQNLMNQFAHLGTQVTHAVQAGIAALPLYLFQRASPGLYELFQTYAKKAEVAIQIATKTCEEMEAQVKAGEDPYEDFIRVARGEAWKKEAAGGKDVVQAKENVGTRNGDDGITWMGGEKAGGKDQDAIRIVYDTTFGGFNVTMGRAPAAADTSFPPVKLTQTFPSADEAANYAIEVLGDLEIYTCQGGTCPTPQTTLGLGLIQKFELEIPGAQLQMDTVMATPVPRGSDLKVASAPGIVITRELIDAIRELPPIERRIAEERLVQDVALARTVDKALIIRNLLLTGRMIPEVFKYANPQIETKLAELNRHIDDVLYESNVRKRVISETAGTLLDSYHALRAASAANSVQQPVDKRPLIDGRVKK
ncbi:integrating conjugative element protein [Aromatoleum anaerobium]|uniref:Integrating conjugative element protein n=1 Tax=Aromatoleum anaerobium TaxID=182180 RepID=A0ABX1PP35_9RHOO|nr:integrating conjugative element protein [Aromatoleum anaerobium]MCK0508635.1 integrating conjugative element protein [Aromatoleum anaerobium]